MTNAWDKLKSALPLALGIYPFFVGLYTAGLFWDVPRDALGGFSFSDLLFKSSVIYASLAGGLLTYILTGSSFYAIISEKPKENSSVDHAEGDSWRTFSNQRKWTYALASIGIFALLLFSLWIDPLVFRIDPNGFAGVLGIIFVIALPFRIFIEDNNWRVAGLLYLMCWAVIGPLALGYSDAQPDTDAKIINLGGLPCTPVLIGANSSLLRCKDSYVLTDNENFGKSFTWKLSTNHPDVVSARRRASDAK